MLGALPPIFAGLPLEYQQEASSFLEPITVEPGEAIMMEGEEDATIAFIATGSCEIWRGETKIGNAAQRDMIGEAELFGQMPRINSVTAATKVTLQALSHEAFVALAGSGNPIVYQLERAAVRRISERIGGLNEGIVQYTRGVPFALHPRSTTLMERLTAPFRKKKELPAVDVGEVLARSDLLSWAPPHLVQDIADHFQVARFEADQLLCRQGEEGDRMFVIASGTAEVVVLIGENRAQTIATLEPGQAFGDTSMALASPRTASVVSREELVALVMDRAGFRELYASDEPGGSAFRQAIIRNLIQHLLPTMDRYVEVVAGATPPDEGLYKGTPVEAMWRD